MSSDRISQDNVSDNLINNKNKPLSPKFSNLIILLDKNQNTQLATEEEKNSFIRDILIKMGMPIDFWLVNTTLSSENKLKLQTLLLQYEVQIVDNNDIVQIKTKDQLIAEWYKPFFKLKKDLSKDKKNQLYLEMIVKYFSLFIEDE